MTKSFHLVLLFVMTDAVWGQLSFGPNLTFQKDNHNNPIIGTSYSINIANSHYLTAEYSKEFYRWDIVNITTGPYGFTSYDMTTYDFDCNALSIKYTYDYMPALIENSKLTVGPTFGVKNLFIGDDEYNEHFPSDKFQLYLLFGLSIRYRIFNSIIVSGAIELLKPTSKHKDYSTFSETKINLANIGLYANVPLFHSRANNSANK